LDHNWISIYWGTDRDFNLGGRVKTKEIDVWILCGRDIFDVNRSSLATSEPTDPWNHELKAKLIIELPGPKKEVTPSMIDEAWGWMGSSGRGINQESFKKQLFGENYAE